MARPIRKVAGWSERPTILPEFWENVKQNTVGCWIWQGEPDDHGYGRFKGHGAHIVSYKLFKGRIQRGMHIDHTCRNRRCVNPLHLEQVTPQENNLRGTSPAAVNKQKTHCGKGHEFTPQNTYVNPRTKARTCITCRAEWNKRRAGASSH